VVDKTWYAAHHLAPPRSLADLTDPAYQGQLVLPGATTSSPGMAFLLATIGTYGDGWPAYWKKLLDNGAKVTQDWTQAFETNFTQGGHHGSYPIVVSYDSDPAFTIRKGSHSSTTKALLDTCFRQVEYAGVLTGAANPKGAQAFIDFLLGPTVQRSLPDSMYVFPVRAGTPLPKEWASFAVQPRHPIQVSPEQISAHRDAWLRQWSDIVSG
jgi:thiamine transport system substrate-binding protein